MSVSAAHVVCCLLLLSAIASSCRSSGQTAGDSWTSRDAAAASTPVELFRQCAAKDAILANLVTFNPNNEAQQHNPENWNTYFDSIRHPAAVAHPTTTEQVSQLVKCAAAANLRFVVRGGGRSYEAMSTIHNGLLLDFGQMGSIQVTDYGHACVPPHMCCEPESTITSRLEARMTHRPHECALL